MGPRLIMLVGVPASGKSTWAQEYINKHSDVRYISSDSIREFEFGDVTDMSHNRQIFLMMKQSMSASLKRGQDVILDATFIKKAERAGYIKEAKQLGAEVFAYFFKTDLESAIKRNTERERFVPVKVIEKRLNELEEPDMNEGFDRVVVMIM